MLRIACSAVLLVSMAGAGVAQASSSPEKELNVEKPVQVQLDKINRELRDGKTYAEIDLDERSRAQQALLRISNTVERYPDLNAMPQSERVALFNDQEVVNTILTKGREDSRVVCRREKVVGSNMPINQCMTVAERERRRNSDQSKFSQVIRSPSRPNN